MLLLLYSIFPFIILITSNIILIKSVLESKRKASTSESKSIYRKHIRMGMTIVIISFLFCIFTLPTASIQVPFTTMIAYDTGQLILSICNVFSFTYHASNFLMLFFTNTQFSKEFKTVLGLRRNKFMNKRYFFYSVKAKETRI